MDTPTEKTYWEKFLNKRVTVSKSIQGKRPYNYTGIIIQVLEDKLIIQDSIAEKILTFEGLSLLEVEK